MRPWVWVGLIAVLGCKRESPGVCGGDGDCAGGRMCTAYGTCVDPIDLPPGSGAPGSCAEPLPPGRCAVPHGESWRLDHNGARDVLPGRWLRCAGQGVIDPGEAGLEFTRAGEWFQLIGTSEGRIERGSLSESGTWTTEDTGLGWQLTLNRSNGFTLLTPALVRTPLKMRPVPERRDLIYVYAPTADCAGSAAPDAAPPDARPSGPCAEPLPPLACEQPSATRVTITDKSLRTLFPGRWLHCGGPHLVAPDAIGFEAVSDGHWYRLALDEQGRLVRATGFDSRGRWQTRQDLDQVQVDMYNDSGGVGTFHAEFRDSPRNLFAVGVRTASRYVEAPPARCP